jgi:adenylate cyclase class IV
MQGRRRNLEIKASIPIRPRRCRRRSRSAPRTRAGCTQRDTYFHAVQGRLKLREAPPQPAELIAYARAELTEPKISLYRVVPVTDHLALIDALTDSLGVRVVVEKTRRLLRWRTVRIHLDRVDGLKDFVELEAVAASPGGLEVDRDRVEELRAALGIVDEQLVSLGYADLMTNRGRAGIGFAPDDLSTGPRTRRRRSADVPGE